MKKILFLLLFCISLQTQVLAQVSKKKTFEITSNPLGVLFIPNSFFLPISTEFILKDNLGVGAEAFGLTSNNGSSFLLYGSLKYYFNPKLGGDRFYVGSFLGGGASKNKNTYFNTLPEETRTNLGGLGFMVGQKWVSTKHVVIDIGIGLGRDFTKNVGFLPYAKLHIGYRFENKQEE